MEPHGNDSVKRTRLRPGVCGTLIALLVGLVLSFAVAANALNLGQDDRLQVFEKIWTVINARYYDPALGGVDWHEVHEKYLPLVKAVKDDKEFYSLMDRMTGELHDAHTRFSSPEQWANRKKHQGVSLGFRPGFVEGKVAVLEVAPGSNAAKAGLEPGMIITALDGKPMAEQVTAAEQKVLPSSSERATKLRVLSTLFMADVNKPVALSLQREDGSVLEANFARQVLSNAPKVVATKLPSGFGYIRFDEFERSLVRDFKKSLQSLRGTPGLILDLRRNRGGDGATLSAMAGFFFNKKTLFEIRMSRKQIAASSQKGRRKEETRVFVGRGDEQIYSGPLVILTSEYSASAAEVFAAGMQDSGRAAILGSQSCGCVLGITHDRVMKGGGVLELSEVLWFSPKERKLEGEGVLPEKTAVLTLASLQANRDSVLQQAEERLREMAAMQHSVADP